MKKNTPAQPGQRQLSVLLWVLAVLTVCNLLLSASLAGLLGGIVILVMIWGIRRGDYPLTKALRIFLLIYGAVNLLVLAITAASGAEARPSALIWLGIYSLALIVLSGLLHRKAVRDYLHEAQPPEQRKKRIHFFHGGWRDL